MPRKTSFCNAALLRSDIKRYWPLLFLYVAVWVVILPMQILSASRECDGVAEGIMTVLQLRQHNVIIQSIPASVVMSLLFGCFAAMAVWSYLMSGRTVGLMHALPVTRTQAFFSHVLSALGALTAGNVLIFLLTALCSAGFSYVDWAALGTWLLLTELMALFFFALGSLCAMVTGWLLAVPVLYGAMNVIALLLYAVISTMTQMFYFGYSNSDIPEFITWLTPVGRIWDAVANGGAQPIEVQFREPIAPKAINASSCRPPPSPPVSSTPRWASHCWHWCGGCIKSVPARRPATLCPSGGCSPSPGGVSDCAAVWGWVCSCAIPPLSMAASPAC